MDFKVSVHNFARAMMLPLAELDRSLPKKGKIVDLGCGEGVIATYLAGRKNRQVLGIDINTKRVQKTHLKNLKFKVGDIRNYNLKNIDGVVLSDVLHHINPQDQKKVLSNVAFSLKKGACLIIKEINTEEFIRSKLSRFWDFVFYPKEKIYFLSAGGLIKNLQDLGFIVERKTSSHFFPGSTNLFICTKNDSKNT